MKTAHLYDPMMALHTSDVEPLPHQITAVYEAMLPKQPLRFVLADFFAGGCLPLRPHFVAAYPLTREHPVRSGRVPPCTQPPHTGGALIASGDQGLRGYEMDTSA